MDSPWLKPILIPCRINEKHIILYYKIELWNIKQRKKSSQLTRGLESNKSNALNNITKMKSI
jgi:hypothetical protein